MVSSFATSKESEKTLLKTKKIQTAVKETTEIVFTVEASKEKIPFPFQSFLPIFIQT